MVPQRIIQSQRNHHRWDYSLEVAQNCLLPTDTTIVSKTVKSSEQEPEHTKANVYVLGVYHFYTRFSLRINAPPWPLTGGSLLASLLKQPQIGASTQTLPSPCGRSDHPGVPWVP